MDLILWVSITFQQLQTTVVYVFTIFVVTVEVLTIEPGILRMLSKRAAGELPPQSSFLN